jgi:S1-C subfamily serine protease
MRGMITAVLVSLLIQPLAAQERSQDSTSKPKRIQRVWVNGEDVTDRFMPLMQRRARLGLVVNLAAKETDSLGAFVQSVSPGGPAAKAGIRSGDIITKLDGKSLLTATGRRVDEEESAPGVRLIEMAAKLEPNDTVQVEYLRGDARRSTNVVTGDEAILGFEDGNRFFFKTPEGERERMEMPPGFRVEPFERGFDQFERRPGIAMAYAMGPLSDLELAPLNADLGSYFGTTEGILVIHAPSGSTLGLKGGDVILSIDGRKPQTPSSLLRILRSYEEDETIKLEIIRQKQRQTLTGKLGRVKD